MRSQISTDEKFKEQKIIYKTKESKDGLKGYKNVAKHGAWAHTCISENSQPRLSPSLPLLLRGCLDNLVKLIDTRWFAFREQMAQTKKNHLIRTIKGFVDEYWKHKQRGSICCFDK